MPLPTIPISEANLLTEDDDPNLARVDLLALVQSFNGMLGSFGTPNGLALLDDAGKISTNVFDGEQLVSALAPWDGAGTGLDADTVDGLHAAAFVQVDGSKDWTITAAAPQRVVFQTINGSAHHSPWQFINSYAGATLAGYGIDIAFLMTDSGGTTEIEAADIGVEWVVSTAGVATAAVTLTMRTIGTLDTAFKFYGRRMEMLEIPTTPAGNPPSGSWWVYFLPTGLHIKDDLGAEVALGSGAGVSDHGLLTGLGDDDHTQYLLVNGSRAMTGTLLMGNNVIQYTDRADPASPPSGQVYVYSKGQGLYYKIAAGTVIGPLGTAGGGGGDHGGLTGLADDDHTQYLLRQPTANVVLNNSQGDFDYTLKTVSRAQMMVIDSGLGYVGFNQAPTASNGIIQATTTATEPCMTLTSSGASPMLVLTKTGTASFGTGVLSIDSGSPGRAAFIRRSSSVAVSGSSAVVDISETGAFGGDYTLRVSAVTSGKGPALFSSALGSVLSLGAGEVAVNDASVTVDFRVEGAVTDHLLYTSASQNTVNVNGALNTARFNVTGGGQHGLYSISNTAGRYAGIFEITAGGYAVNFVGNPTTGRGSAFWAASVRDQVAIFTKNLAAQSLLAPYAVGMFVESPGDTANVLYLENTGTGDYFTCGDGLGDFPFRIPFSGGSYWKNLGVDMPTPDTGYHGLYFKGDGLYIRADDGEVFGPLGTGSGGGDVESDTGFLGERRIFEQELTLTGTSTAMAVATPAGCMIELVAAKVTLAFTGGFHVGFALGDTTFGKNVPSTLGSSSFLLKSNTRMVPAHNSINVTVSCPAGSFSGGKVMVRVIVIQYTEP